MLVCQLSKRKHNTHALVIHDLQSFGGPYTFHVTRTLQLCAPSSASCSLTSSDNNFWANFWQFILCSKRALYSREITQWIVQVRSRRIEWVRLRRHVIPAHWREQFMATPKEGGHDVWQYSLGTPSANLFIPQDHIISMHSANFIHQVIIRL